MAVCAEYRIPHGVFLGWSALDRDKAVWWRARQAGTCQQCGTRPDEWDEKQGGDLNAYTAEPRGCRGCQVMAQGNEWLERHRKEVPRGTTVQLVPNPEVR